MRSVPRSSTPSCSAGRWPPTPPWAGTRSSTPGPVKARSAAESARQTRQARGGGGEKRGRIYMRVDDLDGYLDRAEQLGGKRLVPPTDLPGDFGRFAIFTDPDGNQVGLWS